MGKCAAASELQKQNKLIARLDKKKKELADATRENNKSLDSALLELRGLIDDDNADLYAKGSDDDEGK